MFRPPAATTSSPPLQAQLNQLQEEKAELTEELAALQEQVGGGGCVVCDVQHAPGLGQSCCRRGDMRAVLVPLPADGAGGVHQPLEGGAGGEAGGRLGCTPEGGLQVSGAEGLLLSWRSACSGSGMSWR